MNRRKVFGIIFVVAALMKLADMWGIISLDWLLKKNWEAYFGPLLILYIGVELIISSYKNNHNQWLQRPLPIGDDGKRICCSAHFGGDEYVYHGETFKGARLDAFCGGLRVDLREAVITEDEEIDIHTFLGGVELYIPKNVNVVVKSRSFIGGVTNETDRKVMSGVHTLHLTASNMFGNVSIKY